MWYRCLEKLYCCVSALFSKTHFFKEILKFERELVANIWDVKDWFNGTLEVLNTMRYGKKYII